jgi:hypothetical protein
MRSRPFLLRYTLILSSHLRLRVPSRLFSSGFRAVFLSVTPISQKLKKKKTKLRGTSPQANYTDRATAACRRS